MNKLRSILEPSFGATLTFHLIGLFVILMWPIRLMIPDMIDMGIVTGIAGWFLWVAIPQILMVGIILLFQPSLRTAPSRNWKWHVRFLAILFLSGAAGAGSVAAFRLVATPSYLWYGPRVGDVWTVFVQSMAIYGAFSWLALQYFRHNEDRARFAAALTSRIALARQLAQSEFLAARAQINPHMVSRVLKEIRRRYRTDHVAAATLLDDLIAYLRLAMNRNRDPNPSFASELTMIRSYLALHETEYGTDVTLRVDLGIKAPRGGTQGRAAGFTPLFVVVRKLFETDALRSVRNVLLNIRRTASNMEIDIDMGMRPMNAIELDQLSEALNELPLESRNIRHHTSDDGTHVYAIRIPAQ